MRPQMRLALLFSAVVALLALSGRPAAAYSPLGYPGSMWGNFYREFDGLEGTGIQGHVTQGVDWFKLPLGVTCDTFGGYNWRFRTLNKDYFNAHGPEVGMVLKKGPIGVGADFVWLYYPELRRTSRDFAFFADWYETWNIAKALGAPSWHGHAVRGLPLTTWGRMSHDLNATEGQGSQGWVKQGIHWIDLPYKVGLVTYGSYNWRVRSKNRPYYNTHGPSAGLSLEQRYVNLGLEYAWRNFPELQRSTRSLQLYLTWYFDWDLKKR